MKYYKAIIFCTNPLPGFYRFEDKFQIYPLLSENAPKSDKVKVHAVILEYCMEEKDVMEMPDALKEAQDVISNLTHSLNYQKQLLGLLSSISNYRFFFPQPSVQWFAELPDGELTPELNNQISKAGLNLFWYPEMPQESTITAFTELTIPEVHFVGHPDSFMNIDVDGTAKVSFSEHISAAIHNYFALDSETRDTVDSAISLICNGIDLRVSMKSLSFISFVSSIETMVNHEFREEEVKKCPGCHTEQYRVMGKYRDYLMKYASESASAKKKMMAIYKLRSKIVHAGLLFFGDNKVDWSDDAKQNEQWHTHTEAMQLSRLSLTNWLLMRA